MVFLIENGEFAKLTMLVYRSVSSYMLGLFSSQCCKIIKLSIVPNRNGIDVDAVMFVAKLIHSPRKYVCVRVRDMRLLWGQEWRRRSTCLSESDVRWQTCCMLQLVTWVTFRNTDSRSVAHQEWQSLTIINSYTDIHLLDVLYVPVFQRPKNMENVISL